jgi:hypothetical protein
MATSSLSSIAISHFCTTRAVIQMYLTSRIFIDFGTTIQVLKEPVTFFSVLSML